MLDRFLWWLEHEAEAAPTLDSLTPDRIRDFLAYARAPRAEGRYGSGHARAKGVARPATVNRYFRELRALANFCLEEGLLKETPLRNVKAPKIPDDQIQPFSAEQVQALVDAARRGPDPDRDAAVVLLLLDTGMRESELVGLTVGNVDRGTAQLTVLGKGNKTRPVFMGQNTRRALWRYIEGKRREATDDAPLFVAVGGNDRGAGLTRSGIYQIIRRSGKLACLHGVRCSPHTLRHTFAINFLRGGGDLFELQKIMGHTDLTVLRKYVALAQSDLAEAHRQASPADRLKIK